MMMTVTSQQLEVKARQCRELADTAMTDEGRTVLSEIARKYEMEASAAAIARKRAGLTETVA